MSCARYKDAILELVDGTLGSIRRAELQMHLDECDACRALVSDLQAIRDAASDLPHPMPPERVWLQVAGRLRQEGRVSPAPSQSARKQHYALIAIAAALLLAVTLSILMVMPRFRGAATPAQTQASAPAGNPGGEDVVQGVEAEFRLAEQHYQNAIAKLEEAAKSDQDAIDPQTAAMLQKNLQVIDQAIAESRAALKSEPLSAPARDSLFDALKRKVTVLQDTIALMNEMRKGNAAGAALIVDANKG